MAWRVRWAVLLLLVGACAPTAQDRYRELAKDGLSLYRIGAYAEARESFKAALALQPKDADSVYHLARCQEKLGKPADAENLYRQCTEIAPEHTESHRALVARLVETNRRDEAVAFVQNWLKTRPDLAGPYIEDACLRAATGDLDSARARLQQALSIDPRHARALVELGQIYERLDYGGRALVLYRRSLETDPDQPEIKARVETLARRVSLPHPN